MIFKDFKIILKHPASVVAVWILEDFPSPIVFQKAVRGGTNTLPVAVQRTAAHTCSLDLVVACQVSAFSFVFVFKCYMNN